MYADNKDAQTNIGIGIGPHGNRASSLTQKAEDRGFEP